MRATGAGTPGPGSSRKGPPVYSARDGPPLNPPQSWGGGENEDRGRGWPPLSPPQFWGGGEDGTRNRKKGKEWLMPALRHIAVSAKDPARLAEYYKAVFEM